MSESSRQVGKKYEQQAKEFLLARNIKILDENFYSREGEIDIIGTDGEYLIFFEIKYRKNDRCGSPFEAVSPGKQRKISKTAEYYRLRKSINLQMPIRYDVIGVCGTDIEWLKNAFYHNSGRNSW